MKKLLELLAPYGVTEVSVLQDGEEYVPDPATFLLERPDRKLILHFSREFTEEERNKAVEVSLAAKLKFQEKPVSYAGLVRQIRQKFVGADLERLRDFVLAYVIREMLVGKADQLLERWKITPKLSTKETVLKD